MKRFNYGQNFSVMNSSKWGVLTMLGALEVAPGDTLSGKFTANVYSDTTFRPIMNRTYYDTYAFYVPFRLLWDGWTDFISGKSGGQVPYVNNVNEFYLEGDVTGADQVVPWNRRAYNLIYNTYFRRAEQPELDPDNIFGAIASQRPSTFHESVYFADQIPDTDVTVDTVGGSVSIDDLRQGFSRDRFNKVRAIYGDKYHDYLAALGVKSSWSITDEPEFLGKNASDMTYNNVPTSYTSDAPTTEGQRTGDAAGFFTAKNATRIKGTFCPEHGIIVMIGVARMDLVNRDQQIAPHLQKENLSEYYTPEYEAEKRQAYNGRIIGETQTQALGAPRYEEYRKPSNQYGEIGTVTTPSGLYYATYSATGATPDTIKTIPASVYEALFTGSMGSGTTGNVEYCVLNEVRMLKKSPVKRQQGFGIPIA